MQSKPASARGLVFVYVVAHPLARPPAAGDGVLTPGETAVVDFRIGLQERAPFRFFVDLFAEPLP
jgi:hypothetical protein